MSEAEKIVQKQLNSYNNRDLNSFMLNFSENVKIYEFPNLLISEGWHQMFLNYETMFLNTLDLHCELKNRIVIKNTVIDEEYIQKNNEFIHVVAIYQLEENKISTVTFLKK